MTTDGAAEEARQIISALSDCGCKGFYVKDRHQWWRREFRCSLSLSMDKLFSKAIKQVIYH